MHCGMKEGGLKISSKKKKRQINKRSVHSDFEIEVYEKILNHVPKHRVEYESVKIPYTISHEYKPDFVIKLKSGRYLYIEAKGNGRQFDATVRQKMIAVKKQHPDLDIRMVFYADGKIGPKRKNGTFRRQSDWARENGFIFSIREIPEEWFNE